MRFITIAIIFGMVSSAHASFFSSKKKATDAEGNCVPDLVTENARLYSEIEAMDKMATAAETQLKSPVKESQKLGMESLKQLSAKAKATRAGIKKFKDTYGDAACKAQVPKGKKAEVVMLQVSERVAFLDKFAAQYEKIADDFIKAHPPTK